MILYKTTEYRMRCPGCNSKEIIKRGKRQGKFVCKQLYFCKSCGKRFADDKWHFVTTTFNRDDNLSIYVDGQLENGVIISSISNINNSWPLCIGQQDNFDNRYDGVLDEISVYNRCLSSEEIIEKYQLLNPHQNVFKTYGYS